MRNRLDGWISTRTVGAARRMPVAALLLLLAAPAARAQYQADDFHACDLDTIWTFVDAGDPAATVAITGAYTDDAHLALSVPGGSTHEIWNTVGAPHVRQPLAPGDFTAAVKFTAVLPTNFGQQGLLVRQSDSQWLRLEIYRNEVGQLRLAAVGGPNTVFFDVGFVSQAAPLFLRVTRAGDTWNLQWSPDGTNWQAPGQPFDYAFAPDSIGIYAGNRGANPPAHTVHADWFGVDGSGDDIERNTLAVDVIGDGAVTRGPDLTSYGCGQAVTLTALDQLGWTFGNWGGALSGTANPAVLTMNGPATVTATFVPATVDTLVVAVAGGGSYQLSPPGGVYNRGTVVTVTAVDGPGWAFTEFTGDLNGAINPQTITMDGNRAVTVAFGPVSQFTITTAAQPGGAGSVTFSPAGGTYNVGTTVIATAVAAPGWAFSGWSGDLTGAVNPQSILVDGHKSITAGFVQMVSHALVTTVSGNGQVLRQPDDPQYLYGTSVVLTAVADPGWRFVGWSGDLTGSANPDTLLMDDDKAVHATFAEQPPVFLVDDFNRCELGPLWTVVDPFEDGATAGIVNAYTDSARVAIYVPGVIEHEIWNGIIGAAHILQPSWDKQQFTIEAKFDSRVPEDFGQEGIIVKQDEAHWVRAEFFRDDFNNLRVAVDRGPAQITHDVFLPPTVDEPLYMRLTRDGDNWTQYWSEDGIAWNVAGTFFYSMTVTEVGLFAGNRGIRPPAHTVEIDYFHNGAGLPAAEDSLRNRLEVAVSGSGQVLRALNKVDYLCGDTETLTAVPDPGWSFAGWAGQASGSQNPLAVAMTGPRTIGATFVPVVVSNHVGVVAAPGACLSTAIACVDSLPVRITRTDATPLKSFSVRVELTDLQLCAGTASVREGNYLSDHGATTFEVAQNPDGSIQVDGALTGAPCDADGNEGVLFWLDVSGTVLDGTGLISLAAVVLRDCDDQSLPVGILPAAAIVIDHTPPPPVTDVAATQVLAGNPAAPQTAIDVSWTAPGGTETQAIEVWRRGFGFAPEYDDGGGAAPTAPGNGADPAALGWVLVGTLPPGTTAVRDNAPARDYWYYHVRALDACGNAAGAATLPAALDHLLADVAGGGGGLGDNRVDAADVAALAAAYGAQDGQPSYDNRLDVGPTATGLPFALPATDNTVGFEDLMIFSLSHGLNAGPGGNAEAPPSPSPAARNFLMLDVEPVPSVVGQTFTVTIRMEGDGAVQGLSLPLQWNAAAVRPVTAAAGAFLAAQGGTAAVFMPQPGRIDVALLGLRERGISGTGAVAVVAFEVLGPGQPDLAVGDVTARNQANQPVPVASGGISATPDLPPLPVATALHQNTPNPFNPQTVIAFDLARAGRVRLQVYTLDGRLVRELVDGELPAGRHAFKWDGADDGDHRLASGVYLTRLTTPDGTLSGRMTMLK